jgi:hypothetical protein
MINGVFSIWRMVDYYFLKEIAKEINDKEEHYRGK